MDEWIRTSGNDMRREGGYAWMTTGNSISDEENFSNFHNKHKNNCIDDDWRWWDEIFLCETVANGLIWVEKISGKL